MGNSPSSNKPKPPESPVPVLATLALLRARPEVFFTTYGVFMSYKAGHDGNGGKCSLILKKTTAANTYELEIGNEAGTDWFLPFRDKRAEFIDVPKGQPDGTLVVTHPMNGCALSVHETTSGQLRFFHDSDGKCMGELPSETGAEKFRVTASTYRSGMTLDEEENKLRKMNMIQNTVNAIISVKRGVNWEIYNSAIITIFNFEMERVPIWITKNIPYKLGSFIE
ncbi:hypothetical protein [Pseudomonas nunensis]|uniref:hypothetical protein n=1 Tax=Pseudomonas nunensis TaxID=2961896 RepID=UPI0006B439AA|nr:hypothetical protein [Pseudomonas nunensis]KOY03200.1 hypothetical protein AM274_10295 [Pseudomonas nunensis]